MLSSLHGTKVYRALVLNKTADKEEEATMTEKSEDGMKAWEC